MHKISVVLPIYNSSKYLNDCLDSLVFQTIDDIEIIAIDDCSTDNSFEILKEYKNKFPNKIKIFKNDKNIGQSKTRNKGIALATGLYVGFIDSDDSVHPHMYEQLFESAIKNNFPDIVSTGLIFVKDSFHMKNDMSFIVKSREENISLSENPEFLYNVSPSCCNKLFRRDILYNKQFLDVRMWEDFAFTYSSIISSERIVSSNEPFYYYRKHSDVGVSHINSNPNDDFLNILTVADAIGKWAKESINYDLIKDYVKNLQIVICLNRINEMLDWNISKDLKDKLIVYYNSIIYKKYGDYRNIDTSFLSSKIGICLLDLLKSLPIINDSESVLEENAKKVISYTRKK